MFLPQGMLAFRVPAQVSWGSLFSVMEEMKSGQDPACNASEDNVAQNPLVEDYSASDTSLEQVFLSFAREGVNSDPNPLEIPSEIITKI